MTKTRLACLLSVTLVAACGGDDGASPDAPPATPDGGRTTVVDLAREAGTFTTLLGALEATGLDDALAGDGPFTVFAPTDAAFALLPEGAVAGLDAATLETVLSYHVIAGDVRAADVVTLTEATPLAGGALAIEVAGADVYLNAGTRVTMTDLVADNGVVHVIDSVLLPQAAPFPGTITDALVAYPRFSTLVSAATTAGLADDLASTAGDGLTLFAPTNQAFDALDVDLATLTPSALADVLLYHVVPGVVDAATVVGLSAATTAQGQDVDIAVAGGVVTLNDTAHVTYTDRRTSNGIIHVLDGVLLPAAK